MDIAKGSPVGSAAQRKPRLVAPPRLGMILLGFVLMIILAILGPAMTFSDVTFTGDGSPVRQAAYLVAAALVLFGARPRARIYRLLAIPVPVVISLLVCWVSLIWAIEPGVAARRLVLTTTIIWTICITVEQLGYERTLKALRVVLLITLVANFTAVLWWPELGIHQNDVPYEVGLVGNWRGVMMHKNFAGAVTALTILLFLFDARLVPKLPRIAVLAAGGIFLVMTQSRTSLGMIIAAIAVGFLFMWQNVRFRALTTSILCVAAFIVAMLVNIYKHPIAYISDDPRAFTGRSVIWQALEQYSGDHRLLGAGYGSFWDIGHASPIFDYGSGWVLNISSGHNGFLDLLVEIGLPGLIIVVTMLVIWPIGRLLLTKTELRSRGNLLIALLTFCIGHNFTETSILDRDSIPEVFLIVAIAMTWTITARRTAGTSGAIDRTAGEKRVGRVRQARDRPFHKAM